MFTGAVSILNALQAGPVFVDSPPKVRALLSELGKFARPLRRKLCVVFLLLGLNGLLRLPVPFLTIFLVDRVIPSRSFHRLLVFVLLVVAMSVLFIAADFVRGLYAFATSRRLYAIIYARLLEHVQSLPMSYFTSKDAGYVMSRFLDDGTLLKTLVTDTVLALVQNGITFVIGLFAIFYINWELAAVSLSVLPLFVYLNVRQCGRLRELNIRVQEAKAVVAESLHENISGIAVLKAFCRQRWALLKSFRTLRAALNAEQGAFLAASKVSATVYFLSSLGPLIVLCYGGYEVMSNRLTLGQLLGFTTVIGYLYGPSQALTGTHIALQKSLGALQRISEVLHLSPESETLNSGNVDSCPVLKTPVDICFEKVSFAYTPGHTVLHEITFGVPGPCIVAIVGESGAGKTTLLNLLMRFYEPREGAIYFGGRNIRSVDINSVRRQVALVSQDTFLFNTSIAENIRLGRRSATDNDVVAAAQLASAHEFILKLPEGYETLIGTRGQKLSFGQRQRIALARAALSNPKILILDEATSSVDTHSEELIWGALNRFAEGRITFVVSHRLSSVVRADKTVLLRGGRLISMGTHADLLKDPEYYRLYRAQLCGQNGKDLEYVSLA